MNLYFKILFFSFFTLTLSLYTIAILFANNSTKSIEFFTKLTNKFEICDSLYFFENDDSKLFLDYDNISYKGRDSVK